MVLKSKNTLSSMAGRRSLGTIVLSWERPNGLNETEQTIQNSRNNPQLKGRASFPVNDRSFTWTTRTDWKNRTNDLQKNRIMLSPRCSLDGIYWNFWSYCDNLLNMHGRHLKLLSKAEFTVRVQEFRAKHIINISK